MLSSFASFLLTVIGGTSLLCGLIVFVLWLISFLCLSVKVNGTNLTAPEKQECCRDVFAVRTGEVKTNVVRAGWTVLVLVLMSVLLWLSVEEEQMAVYLDVVKSFSVWTAVLYAVFALGGAVTSMSAPQLVQKHGASSDLVSCKQNFATARRILAALLVLCVVVLWVMRL